MTSLTTVKLFVIVVYLCNPAPVISGMFLKKFLAGFFLGSIFTPKHFYLPKPPEHHHTTPPPHVPVHPHLAHLYPHHHGIHTVPVPGLPGVPGVPGMPGMPAHPEIPGLPLAMPFIAPPDLPVPPEGLESPCKNTVKEIHHHCPLQKDLVKNTHQFHHHVEEPPPTPPPPPAPVPVVIVKPKYDFQIAEPDPYAPPPPPDHHGHHHGHHGYHKHHDQHFLESEPYSAGYKKPGGHHHVLKPSYHHSERDPEYQELKKYHQFLKFKQQPDHPVLSINHPPRRRSGYYGDEIGAYSSNYASDRIRPGRTREPYMRSRRPSYFEMDTIESKNIFHQFGGKKVTVVPYKASSYKAKPVVSTRIESEGPYKKKVTTIRLSHG